MDEKQNPFLLCDLVRIHTIMDSIAKKGVNADECYALIRFIASIPVSQTNKREIFLIRMLDSCNAYTQPLDTKASYMTSLALAGLGILLGVASLLASGAQNFLIFMFFIIEFIIAIILGISALENYVTTKTENAVQCKKLAEYARKQLNEIAFTNAQIHLIPCCPYAEAGNDYGKSSKNI